MSQLMEEQAKSGINVSALIHADTLQSENGCYQWQGCKIYEVKSFGQLVFAPVAPLFPGKLIKAIRQEEPDILHVHMPNLSAFWILFIKRFFSKKAKIIIHWHADVLGSAPTRLVRLFYPFYRVLESWMLKKAHKVIATSPPYLQTSVPLQPFADKCVVVPLGIKLQEFDIRSKTFFSDGALKLCMIGRLSYYKGHSLVLKALRQLKEKNISVHLDVIGDGELKDSLHEECSMLGISDMITWHGSVGESIKEDVLKKSHLLLLPSLERTEAFGVVLLEAANYGVPALISDVEGSGMSYVVEDGLTGIITKASNSESIVQLILNLASGKKLIEYSANAYAKVLSHFDIKAVSTKINKLYTGIGNE